MATNHSLKRPRGMLFDYGDTLVEEVSFNARAGLDWLLTRATNSPGPADVERILQRARRVSVEVADRRDEFHVETPWPALTRLIHDACGTKFGEPLADLELGFWNASVVTRPMPGVVETLTGFRNRGIPMGVVSNSSFSQSTIRYELSKHGIAPFFDVIVVSAEYAVRKPNPLLVEAAARLIDVPCEEIWFVGDRLDTDVAAASAAGMTPIHFLPSGTSSHGLTIAGWSALATLFHESVA